MPNDDLSGAPALAANLPRGRSCDHSRTELNYTGRSFGSADKFNAETYETNVWDEYSPDVIAE